MHLASPLFLAVGAGQLEKRESRLVIAVFAHRGESAMKIRAEYK